MLLGLLPLAALALITAGVAGIVLLSNLGRSEDPGAAVDIKFLPEDSSWVVKVYKGKAGDYEGHLYRSGVFQRKASGFATPELAIGWGFSYARMQP